MHVDVKANTYDVGETVTITGTFTEAGELGDPSTVRFIYKNPANESTTLIYGTDTQITKVSKGVYSMDLHLDTPGFWHYRVDDGDSYIAIERKIQVKTSKLV